MDTGRDTPSPGEHEPIRHPSLVMAAVDRFHVTDHQLLAHLALGIVLTTSIFFGILLLTRH